jgi:hypothetical protein
MGWHDHGAKMRAETTRNIAKEALGKPPARKREAWSIRMEGLRSRPDHWSVSQCWLGPAGGRVQPLKSRASLPLDAIRQPY